MMTKLLAAIVAFAFLAIGNLANADAAVLGAVFSDNEATIIRAWYREHENVGGSKIRGRKDKGGLPPGIAKNLRSGKPLPPGISKRALPSGLINRLPPAPAGFDRIEIAGKILLVEIATRVIHDVLDNVVFD